MTHEGEFSDPLLQLIELIIMIMTMKGFKPHAERLKTELPDGTSTAFKTAKYRTNFKDALMCGSTKGLGSIYILLTTDKPRVPQTLSIAEAQKAPSIEQWERNVSAIDPFELSQVIYNNLPSESARPSSKSSTKAPVYVVVIRHTTVAELSLSESCTSSHYFLSEQLTPNRLPVKRRPWMLPRLRPTLDIVTYNSVLSYV
jgi:hypothetical protein